MTNESISKKAILIVMEYERKHGREPIDVHSNRRFKGCDVLSISEDRNDIRIIEVKGTAVEKWGIPDLAENEVTRSGQLTAHYLYLVKFKPKTEKFEKLFIIPAQDLSKEDFQEFKSYRIKNNFYTRHNNLEDYNEKNWIYLKDDYCL